ncbi:thioesterase superfamily protein [Stackebrandtia nassauensis DSM 44728]|uniref:Thioesterase superfamily protein n=2 Tax=Stackebrandtia TaxID=283810 RepID=D3Q6P0_STANL|nr:thioesterase family protein [Stackebrandtia nassauensis]ADD44283.1 thioesterase superfamily protein [Stackebrandtia nassauensis DSM 44728]
MARFTYRCPLRWSDLDAFGHVNNARFLTLYEEARVALFFNVAKESGMVFEEGVVIARHEIDYKRPVDYVESVRVEMWVGEISNSSFTILYEMFDEDALVSSAKSVAVMYDLEARRPRRVRAEEREYLETWQG